MRVTSDFFVSALVRRTFAVGGFATVERRGSTEAGAVFIRRRNRLGEMTLYGPAPQSSYDQGAPNDRRFVVLLDGADEAGVDQRLQKEMRFDSDLWLLELEVDDAQFAGLVEIRTP